MEPVKKYQLDGHWFTAAEYAEALQAKYHYTSTLPPMNAAVRKGRLKGHGPSPLPHPTEEEYQQLLDALTAMHAPAEKTT